MQEITVFKIKRELPNTANAVAECECPTVKTLPQFSVVRIDFVVRKEGVDTEQSTEGDTCTPEQEKMKQCFIRFENYKMSISLGFGKHKAQTI